MNEPLPYGFAYIYPPPPPEQATSAEQLEHLLASTRGIKIEIDYSRWSRASWLYPEDAWMADASGPSREVALETEAQRVATCRRAGVTP